MKRSQILDQYYMAQTSGADIANMLDQRRTNIARWLRANAVPMDKPKSLQRRVPTSRRHPLPVVASLLHHDQCVLLVTSTANIYHFCDISYVTYISETFYKI
jgi:hypothetical protein